MFECNDIREWRGRDVVDVGGEKIGTLEAVYVDTGTDLPAFCTVKIGLPTRHRLAFVPLYDARVGPDYVQVAVAKKLAKSAPSIDLDGVLPAEDEPAVFKHYELDHRTGTGGERRLARR
ncbi:PRC-barrel domain-containing protein [Streptomyces sp. NPDC054802]